MIRLRPTGHQNNPALPPSPAASLPELVRLIGRGSYGEVWLARRPDQTFCAVKIIRRQRFEDARPYEREFLGIQKFAPLSRSYDSQLRILEVGRDDREEFFFYVMELADDEQDGRAIHPERYTPRTLRSELRRRGRLPREECLEIGLALSATLENLHQNGLIHRDVKPSNVVFVEGVPKLADIGLVTDSDVSVSFVGTEGFIPPEGPGSPQADIYSLGKVLYEISTGNDRQTFPELPTSLVESSDGQQFLELNTIIARCCQGDPRQRYPSARHLYSDLAALRRGRSVRLKRALGRQAMVAGCTLAIGLVCFGLAELYFNFNLPTPLEKLVVFRQGKVRPTAVAMHPVAPKPDTPALSFPSRSSSATRNQLDLTSFYNARLDSAWHSDDARLTLEKFPAGLLRLGNTSFDARGLIQLSGRELAGRRQTFPERVAGIPVGLKARRIHFLHGTVWPAREGTHLADYAIGYADEQQHVFPIVYGLDVRDWNVGSDPKTQVGRGMTAWSTWQKPFAFRIFTSIWTNPVPELEIVSLDFASRMEASAPFLIAITVE
ncbi:MAG TPA: serine/threonine-protein kinase [Verrucomicrobiae bacterium]|nr:serine/threonine-protein kinase [Verrucomicrobiae bacterium]